MKTSLICGVLSVSLALLTPAISSDAVVHPIASDLNRTKKTTLLVQLGFGPESLAAAGVSGPEAGELVESGVLILNQYSQQLLASESRVSAARVVMKDDALPLSERTQELQMAEAAHSALLSALTSAIAAEIQDASTRERIARIRSNRLWNVPVKYLTTSRSPEDWAALRQALAADKEARRQSRPVDESVTSVIASAEADSECIRAAQGLERLAEVRSAWTSALASE